MKAPDTNQRVMNRNARLPSYDVSTRNGEAAAFLALGMVGAVLIFTAFASGGKYAQERVAIIEALEQGRVGYAVVPAGSNFVVTNLLTPAQNDTLGESSKVNPRTRKS